MDAIAEVVSIEELRRRRAARDAARAPARPATAFAWVPVWLAWFPVWQPGAAAPARPLRAAGWSGR